MNARILHCTQDKELIDVHKGLLILLHFCQRILNCNFCMYTFCHLYFIIQIVHVLLQLVYRGEILEFVVNECDSWF